MRCGLTINAAPRPQVWTSQGPADLWGGLSHLPGVLWLLDSRPLQRSHPSRSPPPPPTTTLSLLTPPLLTVPRLGVSAVSHAWVDPAPFLPQFPQANREGDRTDTPEGRCQDLRPQPQCWCRWNVCPVLGSAGFRAGGEMALLPLLGIELRHVVGGARWGCREGRGGLFLTSPISSVPWDEVRPP